METLLVLLVVCGLSVLVHKLSAYKPSEKIEYKKFLINRISEEIALICGILMLVITIINLIYK